MQPARILPLPHSINLRELGGYPTQDGRYIAWRKLLRSGSLGHLREADGQALEDYGVVFDIDLRSDSETAQRPDKMPRTIGYQHLSVYPFADDTGFFKKLGRKLRGPKDPMGEAYLQMLTDSHANDVYRDLFSILLSNTEPDQSVLFHCTAGKDRTGIAAMMVEGALGVDDLTIREDYMLTNLVLANPDQMAKADLRHGANQFVNEMNAHGAEASNYEAVEALIKKEYGDWANYVKTQLRLSDNDLKDLRTLYLTDQPTAE